MGVPTKHISDFTDPNGITDDKDQDSGTGMPIMGMPVMPTPPTPTDNTNVDELLINYNEKFKNEDPILFRDEVIEQIQSILIGKNKPNALLIGPAGVGKTKIIEDLARRIAIKDARVPTCLSEKTIFELPLGSLVAGTGIVGSLEEKLKNVLDFLKDTDNQAILFIDEIHQLTQNGGHDSYTKISQLLKPALARGDIKCIGATTTQESKTLMSDPAFNRRFSRVIVDEFTKEQTKEIVTKAKAGFILHHNNRISINDSIIDDVVNLADEYRPAGGHRPDTALTLLDRACGDAIVARARKEAQLANDPNGANLLKALRTTPQIAISTEQIEKTAIKLATGNSMPEKFDEDILTDNLSRIKGQDKAIERIIKELKKHSLHLFSDGKPMTSLFIGPSGVGKTAVAKIIAKTITGCNPIILNMTEYNNPSTVNKIIGSPAGYIGSDSNAELPFDILESNPYQVILLDEFEKGDPSVQKLFMQAMDEGIIKTNKGNEIDFSKAIIIATTNAGYTVHKNKLGFATYEEDDDIVTEISDLTKFFDIALLNRFQTQVTFQPISKDTYVNILKTKYLEKKAEVLDIKPYAKLPDELDTDKAEKIADNSYIPEFGARPAEREIEEFIYNELI